MDAAIGHNDPPDDAALAIARADALVKAADAWKEITSAAEAAKLGDYLTQLRESGRDLEAVEDVEKRPLMNKLEEVRAKFRRARTGIQTAMVYVRGLADDWLKKEQHRLALEKAAADLAADRARRDAEAALQAAQASGLISAEIAARDAMDKADELAEASEGMSTRAVIRSELGGKITSQRATWTAEISDPAKAHKFFLKNPEAVAVFDDAILRVARKMAVALKDTAKAPPGITFVRKVGA